MPKIIKDSIGGKSVLSLGTTTTSISSGPNSISCTNDHGNFVNGPLSISSSFTKIRMGGIYRFNSLLANTIPSTVITPIPVLEIDIPSKEAAGLIGLAAMVLSTLGG